MIRRICSKKTCTGCGACVASCPLHCIRLVPDREGFLYPYINERRVQVLLVKNEKEHAWAINSRNID